MTPRHEDLIDVLTGFEPVSNRCTAFDELAAVAESRDWALRTSGSDGRESTTGDLRAVSTRSGAKLEI